MVNENKPVRKNKLEEFEEKVQGWFQELREEIRAVPPSPKIEPVQTPTPEVKAEIPTPETPEVKTPEVSVADTPVATRRPFGILW